VPFIWSSHPVAASSVKELIALAKAGPGALNFASFGNGTSNHLVGAGILRGNRRSTSCTSRTRAAPRRSTDLLGGQVQMTFDTVPVVLPQVRARQTEGAGSRHAEAVAARADVPPWTRPASRDFPAALGFGVLAPARTPRAVVGRLNQEIAAILRAPDVVQTFTDRGIERSATAPPNSARSSKLNRAAG